jgi:hypothetical protein
VGALVVRLGRAGRAEGDDQSSRLVLEVTARELGVHIRPPEHKHGVNR